MRARRIARALLVVCAGWLAGCAPGESYFDMTVTSCADIHAVRYLEVVLTLVKSNGSDGAQATVTVPRNRDGGASPTVDPDGAIRFTLSFAGNRSGNVRVAVTAFGAFDVQLDSATEIARIKPSKTTNLSFALNCSGDGGVRDGASGASGDAAGIWRSQATRAGCPTWPTRPSHPTCPPRRKWRRPTI